MGCSDGAEAASVTHLLGVSGASVLPVFTRQPNHASQFDCFSLSSRGTTLSHEKQRLIILLNCTHYTSGSSSLRKYARCKAVCRTHTHPSTRTQTHLTWPKRTWHINCDSLSLWLSLTNTGLCQGGVSKQNQQHCSQQNSPLV